MNLSYQVKGREKLKEIEFDRLKFFEMKQTLFLIFNNNSNNYHIAGVIRREERAEDFLWQNLKSRLV